MILRTPLRPEHLTDDKIGLRGRYLVVELRDALDDLPAGTRGLWVTSSAGRFVVVFARAVGVEQRTLSWGALEPLGRIDHD